MKISIFLLLLMLVDTVAIAQQGVQPLVSGQRVQVKKLVRDMTNVRQGIVIQGPSELQDPDIIKARQKRMGQFQQALKRYPQVDDPDVQKARAEYTALQQALSAEFKRAQTQLQQLGDVQQALATIEKNARTYAVPKPLAIPFDELKVKQWLEQASQARTVGEHNQKQLQQIAQLAYLPKNLGTPQTGASYDIDDVDRMYRYALQMQQAVQSNYTVMADQLKNRIQGMDSRVFERWQEDPESDKRWIFLSDDQRQQAKQAFAENRLIANSYLHLEKALNRSTELADSTLKRIAAAEAQFEKKHQIALQTSRLPDPKSKDSDLIEIAESVLQTPKYEFGTYGPIVLTTAAVIEREKKTSELEIDDAEVTLGGDVKFSGTETTWTYRWEEFSFAVPLQETDGRWFIWWITAKNFSSGAANTPIGRWVSGKATKGNLILKENF
ncbi:hypothetical protein [Marinicella sp. W31]|uniref:hypothetical protein n=1 Tax=Marinicella sp. W31 TaxID=3023713 RepID=UPI0037580012